METNKSYENFPVRIVILSNFVSIAIYGLGFFILFRLGWVFSILFLFYILIFELRLIRNHCTSCYYWGKTCGFGKGRLSARLFKKGDISRFCNKEMTWKDLIPDLLMSLIPLIIGIILIIISFNLILLFAICLLVFFTTIGNSFIRGTYTCKYCKQRELGCPAELLFNKAK
jgi:hypothetical protein